MWNVRVSSGWLASASLRLTRLHTLEVDHCDKKLKECPAPIKTLRCVPPITTLHKHLGNNPQQANSAASCKDYLFGQLRMYGASESNRSLSCSF